MGIDWIHNLRELYEVDEGCERFLRQHLGLWESVYAGRPPWRGGEGWHLNAAKLLCEYLAGLNTAELEIRVDGEDPPADRFMQRTLRDNAFWRNLSCGAELCEALGGALPQALQQRAADRDRLCAGQRLLPDFLG